MSAPLLEAYDLHCGYSLGRRFLRRGEERTVVHGAELTVAPAETVALVGESGSGKTTIARAIAGLLTPQRGRILFEGQDIGMPAHRRPRWLLREIQYVFQNPDSSLNPRHTVGTILARPLRLFFDLDRRGRERRVVELLEAVHLDPAYARRLPTQLSGGERQRVAIARALAAQPKLVLCDEVVSALDVSVQAEILDLLRELQVRLGVAYLFIAHDLAVVRWLAHRVLVLYRGHVLETGPSPETFVPPVHPYTETLLAAVPEPGVASLLPLERRDAECGTEEDRAGECACPFTGSCPRRLGSICELEPPPWQHPSARHALRCHIDPAALARAQRFPWIEAVALGRRATP